AVVLGGEIAVFVQVADDGLGGVAHFFRYRLDAQLPAQVVGEGGGGAEKVLKRRPFNVLALGALIAGIEVVLEEVAVVNFLEGIAGGGFGGAGVGVGVRGGLRPIRGGGVGRLGRGIGEIL